MAKSKKQEPIPDVMTDLKILAGVVLLNEPTNEGKDAAAAVANGERAVVVSWVLKVFFSEARGRGDLRHLSAEDVLAAKRLAIGLGLLANVNEIFHEFAGHAYLDDPYFRTASWSQSERMSE